MKIKIPDIIRDYAPRWTKNLESRINLGAAYSDEVDDEFLDMGSYDRCIVGEVNAFRCGSTMGNQHCSYGCITCDRFAEEFEERFIENDKKYLEEQLEAYAEHIQEKHRDKLIELHSKVGKAKNG